ncbi:MAG: hypothetical protein JW963_17880 [Anaerolineales bacterium]|nr:hypothetical protein [Anaerolineales bacterium]
MKKRIVISWLAIGLIIFLGILFYVKVGWIQWGQEDLDCEKMGYSFDVAADAIKNKLYVAAGIRGLHILELERGMLTYITTYYDDGYYRNLKVRETRAFIADARRGLVILDISGDIPLTKWIQSDSQAYGIHIQGDQAYVVAEFQGLEIFDISNPDSPILLSTTKTSGKAWDVWVSNGIAYVADVDKGITAIDVSSSIEPHQVGFVTWAERNPNAEIIRGEGSVICVAAGNHGLIIIDVSDPTNPIVASQYRPVRIGWAEGLAIRDDLVYLSIGSNFAHISTIENGLHILDVTDPYNPRLLSKVNFQDWVEGVFVSGDFAYVANTYSGVRSIGIRNTSHPYLVDTFNLFP